jgi:hypothetical protein
MKTRPMGGIERALAWALDAVLGDAPHPNI